MIDAAELTHDGWWNLIVAWCTCSGVRPVASVEHYGVAGVAAAATTTRVLTTTTVRRLRSGTCLA